MAVVAPRWFAAGLGEWARFADPTMTLETVEQLFQRLASASLGREFMHHLGYSAITVVDAARAPD